MEITPEKFAEDVDLVFELCLAKPQDTHVVLAMGIVNDASFSKPMIQEKRPEISGLLGRLSHKFRSDSRDGNGESFLSMPFLEDGRQWGEHANAEMLLLLGIAAGFAEITVDRRGWHMMPGGMPYVAWALADPPKRDESKLDRIYRLIDEMNHHELRGEVLPIRACMEIKLIEDGCLPQAARGVMNRAAFDKAMRLEHFDDPHDGQPPSYLAVIYLSVRKHAKDWLAKHMPAAICRAMFDPELEKEILGRRGP